MPSPARQKSPWGRENGRERPQTTTGSSGWGGPRSPAANALQGLRTVSPSRPLGRYTRLAALDAAERGDTGAALALLPSAVAAAANARSADSLLFVYGMAAVRARACSTAVPAFESVIRRQHEPAVTE